MAGATIKQTSRAEGPHGELREAFNQLVKDFDALVAKFNAHTHVENTAAAYTQNASTAAIVAGQQAAATTATPVSA